MEFEHDKARAACLAAAGGATDSEGMFKSLLQHIGNIRLPYNTTNRLTLEGATPPYKKMRMRMENDHRAQATEPL